ncbi:MAG: restriction endonuclease [Planktothrix sp.]
MNQTHKAIQKILFGSPGTGKSYKIREIAKEQLGITWDDESKVLKNTIKTVFHPEYTYADFMGKLLPLTQGNSVIYKFYPGHFLQILGMAYRGLIDETNEHYLLVIDELNRGNASAIFGTAFQLLDRESDDWSSYEIDISEMELVGLLSSMQYQPKVDNDGTIKVDCNGPVYPIDGFLDDKIKDHDRETNKNQLRLISLLKQRKISIPSNLSILATINTSDESIYYLDSAFKRRWDWEYIDSPNGENFTIENIPDGIAGAKLIIGDGEEILDWYICVIGLNEIIKSSSKFIRRIEDKQIGWWFVKPEDGQIALQKIKDKVMFYLWDSVFSRDKRPLESALAEATGKKDIKLITYADFVACTEEFIIYANNSALELYPDLDPP